MKHWADRVMLRDLKKLVQTLQLENTLLQGINDQQATIIQRYHDQDGSLGCGL